MIEDRAEALLSWYGRHRRDLPWRTTTDPWAIMVSEVMAQQTQVSRVIPKWAVFLDRLPTPEACAEAPLAETLALWSGLGYNSRAVRLREAAVIISADGWPTTSADLVALPGVGPYTAAAVACFAFGEQVPTIDTNLRRVLSRWHGAALSGRALATTAASELPHGAAADWNQALMDLGSSLCSVSEPSCRLCPVEAWCADPTVYEPPRPQGRFEGSRRQARGAVMRGLLAGAATLAELAIHTELPPDRLTAALLALQDEHIVTSQEGGWNLTDQKLDEDLR